MSGWTLSGAGLILAVLAIRALAGERITSRTRYALWLPVLLRLLIPVDLLEWRIMVPAAALPVPETFGAMEAAGSQAAAHAAAFRWQDAAGAIWILGTVLVLAFFAVAGARLKRKLRSERKRTDAPGSPVPVYVTKQVDSPCLVGVFRPEIYVTEQVIREGALDHVLAHELTHLRHFDHVFSALRCAALALHWFDPLVWLAAWASKEDAELACDEGALEFMSADERIAYGATLIRLTCTGKGGFMSTAIPMISNRKSIRKRIAAIASRPKRKPVWLAAVLALLLTATGCSFTETTTVATRPSENAQTYSADLTDAEIALLATLPTSGDGAFEYNIHRIILDYETIPDVEDARLLSVQRIEDERAAEGVQVYELTFALDRACGTTEERNQYIIYQNLQSWCWSSNLDDTQTPYFQDMLAYESDLQQEKAELEERIQEAQEGYITSGSVSEE